MKERRPGRRFNAVVLQSMLSDLSHFIALERLGPQITERVLWRAPTGECKVALTFDDGPNPVYTPQLLRVLSRFDVPATFFFIGRHIEKNLALAKEVADSGHELGNHTFTHPVMWRLTDSQLTSEIEQTDVLLRNLNGREPKFFRPPMGLFSKRVLNIVEQAGYRTVVGNVYPRDPHLPGKEKILKRVLSRVIKGSIIILHDGGNGHHVDRSQTIWAVERLIPKLCERGYEFVTLSDLLHQS